MSDPLFDVRDKVVVITGGLGQLGRQYSRALTERGAKVVSFDVREHGTLVPHKGLLSTSVDVTDRDSIERAFNHILAIVGVPHALINNAALDSPPDALAEENGPFETYPEASWDKVMAVNVKGAMLCSQVIGGAMAKAGRGSIINVSSIYGLVSPNQRIYEYRMRGAKAPFFKPVAYVASKSALLNLTRYLATYWATQGVRVNTITLGGVFNQQDRDFVHAYSGRVPMGRMAREDEYCGAMIFLISDASSYMTGANLVIDGGWTAW